MSNAAYAILGALLHHPEAYWRINETVIADDFMGEDRRLFEYLAEGIEAGEVRDHFTAMDAGFDALNYTSGMTSDANIEGWAKQLAEDGECRRVRESAKRIAVCQTYADAQSVLAAVRPRQASRVKNTAQGLQEMVIDLKRRLDAKGQITGTATGLESLDLLTSGWQQGDLVGVAGETSSGKTVFALQASIAAGRCAYFSLEMMASQLTERALCNIGRIPARWMKFPQEAPDWFYQKSDEGLADVSKRAMSLHEAGKLVKALPLLIDDQPGLTVDQIAGRARQLHMKESLSMVVVDHINLVKRPRRNDNAELGEIAISLKNLAKDLKIPVMVLVQLNRGQKHRADRRPQLEDLRSSGEIEEALDTAVMVYRDEYHNPDGPLKGYAEFIVRKQRAGERNVTAWAKSYLSQMRFESCDEPERPVEESSATRRTGGFKARFGTRGQSSAFSRAGEAD
jgi:replicative DNA helicase